MDASAVYPVLVGRGPLASASEAWFDDVNVPATEVPGFCPASALRDEFGGVALAAQWRPWNGAGSCTVRQAGGAAELRFSGEFAACSLTSVSMFDLRDSAFSLQLVALPSVATFQTLIEARTADVGDHVELHINGGAGHLRVYAGGTAVADASAGYDAGAQPFLRLRESAGRLSWDTSADGSAWTTRARVDTSIEVSAVNLVVTGVDNAGGSTQVLRCDHVNAP
jgi:hypothetical protein